ncbi:hypothetical protein VTI28DRAFT_1706 [Corynascus sepedonium]
MSSTPIEPFTFPPSLGPYNVSPTSYLAAHPPLTNLVVSALIIVRVQDSIKNNDRGWCVLLIQRAAHDGFPLKWECPGGCVDTEDEGEGDATILHAVRREVREETGLVVRCITSVVDKLEFDGSLNTKWQKITFLVEVVENDHTRGLVPPDVKLSDMEHVDAVWADEADIMAGRAQGRDIEFAYEAQRQTVLNVLRRMGHSES